jgi:hypothetical protein
VNTQREESLSSTTLRMSACWLPGVRQPSPEGGELPDDGDDGDETERTRAAVGGEGDLGRPGGVVEDTVCLGGELCMDDSVEVLEGGAYRAATIAAIAAASSRSLLVLMERGSPDLSLGGVRVVDVRG